MYTTNWSLGRAALAQSVERLTRNEKVVSSILTGGSTKPPGKHWFYQGVCLRLRVS